MAPVKELGKEAERKGQTFLIHGKYHYYFWTRMTEQAGLSMQSLPSQKMAKGMKNVQWD
jgi:hypothetical protein